MRLPVLGLEHTAAAHTRRQLDGTISSSTPEPSSGIGLSVVIPLVAGFGGIVALSSIFLAWYTFRRRGQTTTAPISTERIRLRAKKKPPVLSIPILALLPIVRFEAADQKDTSVEKCQEERVEAVETSTATGQSQDPPPEDEDSRNPQHPEPVHLDSSSTTNTITFQKEDYEAPTTSSDDDRSPWQGDTATCTICEDDFQVGQDVRLLPCNHGYHPSCVDFWLLNRSATCPLCRNSLALTAV